MIGKCYWIKGLSFTGKTTYSKLLADYFRSNGRKVFASETYSREEIIAIGMSYSRLCQLISDQGSDVIIALIGLFKEIYAWNRENISNYIEIFIDTSIDELIKREPKKLYIKYNNG
jgi:cytidine diphosphoramidate kinase